MINDPQESQQIKLRKEHLLSKLLNTLHAKENRLPVMEIILSEEDELLEGIKHARSEWLDATRNFEYASEKELVDYYAYTIKAYQLRYEYYLKKAKEKGLKVGI